MSKCRLLAFKQALRLPKIFLDTGFSYFLFVHHWTRGPKFSNYLYILISHGTVEAAYFFHKPFRDFPPRPTSIVQKFFKMNTQFNRTYLSHLLSTCYAWLIHVRDWAFCSRSSAERSRVSLGPPWYRQLLFP